MAEPGEFSDFSDYAESALSTRWGRFRAIAFRDRPGGSEHLALVLGRPGDDCLVRVHSECVTGDIFGALRCECGEQLRSALDSIAAEGRGVLVYLPGQEARGTGLIAKAPTQSRKAGDGLETVDSPKALGRPAD